MEVVLSWNKNVINECVERWKTWENLLDLCWEGGLCGSDGVWWDMVVGLMRYGELMEYGIWNMEYGECIPATKKILLYTKPLHPTTYFHHQTLIRTNVCSPTYSTSLFYFSTNPTPTR